MADEAPGHDDDEGAAQYIESRSGVDCDAANTAGVPYPPMDEWEQELVWCMEHGGRPGPRPTEFFSTMSTKSVRMGGASDYLAAHGQEALATALDDDEEPWAWRAAKAQRQSGTDVPRTRSSPEADHGPDWLDGSADEDDVHYCYGVKVEAEAKTEVKAKVKGGMSRLTPFDVWHDDDAVEPAPARDTRAATRNAPARVAVLSAPAVQARAVGTAARESGPPAPTFGPAMHGQPADAKLQQVLAFAGRLGLLGELPGREVSREGETVAARELRLGMLARARQTYDVGRLHASLTGFEEFMTIVRREPPFMTPRHAGDIDCMQYNQETLDMFAEFLRRRGSRLRGRSGEEIKSDTIQTYVSQIKKLRTHEAHHTIVCPEVNVIAPAALKRMRQIDGPKAIAGCSLGLRARHLRAAALAGFQRRSKRGTQEWGAALSAHNLLARGGEVCVVDGVELDVSRDLIIGAVEFKEPGEVSGDLPWLTMEMVPIKDTTARRRTAVMPVRRRSAGGEIGSDPLDTYDAVVLAIEGRIGRMPPTRGRVQGAEALLPLFVGPKGNPWCTADTRRLARRIAGFIGLEEDLYGGKSFRIGGATDYRAVYGPEAAERMIKQRGRWHSDIHSLYTRALAAEHLEGSAAIGDARGAELEALCKGWTQPASFN